MDMISLSHTSALRYLQEQTSSKEGAILAKQLLFFSALWVLISSVIAYFGQVTISLERPTSWLIIILPLMGSYLFILAYQNHRYWQSLGKANLRLAKASFHYHDTIQGYIDFKELLWDKKSQATVHISLKKQLDNGQYQEEWITNADADLMNNNQNIRVNFMSQVHPNIDPPSSPQAYIWCLYISLCHHEELFKQHFQIPVTVPKNITDETLNA